MHILHVACMPYPSMQGSQVYLRGLLRAQAKRHRVSLLCYGHGTECFDDEYEIIRIKNIRGYQRMRAGPDWFKPVLDIRIAKKLWSLEADIIHVHNYEAPFAAYIRKLRGQIPIVYTAHNLMEEELETYFVHSRIQKIARFVGRWLDENIPRRADAVIAIRPKTEEYLRSLGCKQTYTVLPGVESLVRDENCSSEPTVVYTGNVDRYQNLEVFFSLALSLPAISFRLVTSNGNGLPDMIPSNIEIIETDSFQIVCKEISRAQACLVPRKLCSGFPMKLLNALALGVPVVTFSSTAPHLEGVVYCDTILEMKEQLHLLTTKRDLGMALGEKGKKHVLSEYSWEKRAIEVEKIYNYINQ